ncbi:MAG: hypothetical protein J6A63_06470 [Clostridia bacterium]|nr:hypothetical protein [Clostridia bacterium]
MWFLWILITLLVLGISGTQVFSFFYILFNFQEEYNNVTPTKRTSMAIGIIIHSIIMITWIVLCFAIESIRQYWVVLLFTWIIGICFTIHNVKKNSDNILLDLSSSPTENIDIKNSINELESAFQTPLKVQRIKNNPGKIECFTVHEIVAGLVNLLEAKENLSSQEYAYVLQIYESYKRTDKEIFLDNMAFFGLSIDIISSFDLVAPYYMFCGQDDTEFMREKEDEKYDYRLRALQLLEKQPNDFKEQWNTLHEEFMYKFYLSI